MVRRYTVGVPKWKKKIDLGILRNDEKTKQIYAKKVCIDPKNILVVYSEKKRKKYFVLTKTDSYHSIRKTSFTQKEMYIN